MAIERDKQIAETIAQQLGGLRRLQMFLGAYGFAYIDKGLVFRIKNQKANHIKIVLDEGQDLYNLTVSRIRGTTTKVIGERDGLYWEDLKPAIEELTGMYLSLFADGGNIGDNAPASKGDWHAEHKVFDYSEYPEISHNVQKSSNTESVYVAYFVNKNQENEGKAVVRFSHHLSNAIKFGDAIDGKSTDAKDEVLYRLGLIGREWKPYVVPMIAHRAVKKSQLANYKIANLTLDEIKKLGIGADISEYKGKIAKNSNQLIEGDIVFDRNARDGGQRGYYQYIYQKKNKMSKGGDMKNGNQNLYVAVDEVNGYWYVISKPTSRQKAESIITKNSEKVVTLAEAKAHKKIIGEEYLTTSMAKGGGIRASKQYNKDVAAYKYFVVDLVAKRAISGWEYREDANEALDDFSDDNGKPDKNFKVVALSALKKFGVEDPRESWYDRDASGKKLKKGGFVVTQVDYERKVIDILIDKLDIDNGDAQAIVDAHQDVLESCFELGHSAKVCADKIDKARLSNPAQKSPEPEPKKDGKAKVKDIATYVPNRDIKALSVVLAGQVQNLKGSDIIDGVYVRKKLAASEPKDAEAIFKKVVEIGKSIMKKNYGANAKKIGFTAKDIQDLLNVGFDYFDIESIICGYKIENPKADFENYHSTTLRFEGIIDYQTDYQQSKIQSIVQNAESKCFEIGLKYPDFNWRDIVEKFKIRLSPEVHEYKYSSSKHKYKFETYLGAGVAIGHSIAHTDRDGKVWDNDWDEIGKINWRKPSEDQRAQGLRAGFNGGYWGVVCRSKSQMYDIVEMLMSQSDGYLKDIDMFDNGLGGDNARTVKDLKFQKGGKTSGKNVDDSDYKRWRHQLVRIICKDSECQPSEVAMNEEEIREYYVAGISPKNVYEEQWQKDAGNFYNVGEKDDSFTYSIGGL